MTSPKDTPEGSPIDDVSRYLARSQVDHLNDYLHAYLQLTGLSIEDVALAQQTFIENGAAGNRYWVERKVSADPRTARLNPAFAAPYGASEQEPADDGSPTLSLERLLARLGRAAADPMLADHAEVSKMTLRAAVKVVRDYSNLKFAFDEWLTKTEWVQEQKATFPFNTLGMHRADVMRRAIDEMRKLVAVPRTDQEIVDETDDLARELAKFGGYELDGKFYNSPSPRAINYWNMACLAQEKLTATDPKDALTNLETE